MSRVQLKSDQKTIHIRDLIIDDQRAHRILALEADDRIEQKFRDAVAIGFLAIDRTAAISENDWVTQRLESQILQVNYALERQAHEIMNTIRNHFDPEKAGSLLGPMSDLVQKTQKELTTKLSETIAVIGESHNRLEGSIDPRRDGTILREFLNRFEAITKELAESPTLQAKLDALRDEFKSAVTAVRVGVEGELATDQMRQEMIASSPAKGLIFEDQVRDELRRIAEVRNDLVEVVGTSPGKSSKKGDIVYYLAATKSRIVFELKDYASARFSYQKIRDLMEESNSNRDAIFGVFLAKDENCLPEGVGTFHIADDYVIATQPLLEVATKIAILIAHQRIARMGSGEGPDWLSIESGMRDIKTTLEELSDLEGTCATANKAINKTADGIRRVSRSLLEKVEELLIQAGKGNGER